MFEDEATFTKFIDGNTVYARARRLYRATTGRTTKRFLEPGGYIECSYEEMRRMPPPVAAPFIKATAGDLLARLERHQIYLPNDRDLDDLEALGLPRVSSLDQLPRHYNDQILARDGSRSPSAHKVAVRLSKTLRRLIYEREAMRIVGLPGLFLYQVAPFRGRLETAAADADTTDYAAEAAKSAKDLLRRIHKCQSHGGLCFSASCRRQCRRDHERARGNRKRKSNINYYRDFDDDQAGAMDAYYEQCAAAADCMGSYSSFTQSDFFESDDDDDDCDYDLCSDAEPLPTPPISCVIS
ncbi:hypothetical protein SPRG_13273 [Saprolegnia parasitica CBS 223.65]|uniref:Uncharacterized protein n=1 Tax=Saprolegnia parasitica (strain CBS 223.65) TaxID=695850 RepID=A0A067BTK3_SAPPC|nr:hypothetical protein SPRG_13273 [Saprolegnia parasitica CBS 223.65]KDO21588.1 hypothetical protein SPRG_13273 [Saprolegnia parasitica CBS 223.65]|eukprot:XP_012207679.1 hypothetical protein SPRG_13273 [Saprolegnia parasitica CBS 223.65]